MSIIDREYEVYCSNNSFSRLDNTTFKRLFKGKVVREMYNDNLSKLEHYDEIGFCVGDNVELSGKILIDNKHYCEGIVTDNRNEYFLFGNFVGYDYFDLYIVMNDGEVYRYCTTNGYLK